MSVPIRAQAIPGPRADRSGVIYKSRHSDRRATKTKIPSLPRGQGEAYPVKSHGSVSGMDCTTLRTIPARKTKAGPFGPASMNYPGAETGSRMHPMGIIQRRPRALAHPWSNPADWYEAMWEATEEAERVLGRR